MDQRFTPRVERVAHARALAGEAQLLRRAETFTRRY